MTRYLALGLIAALCLATGGQAQPVPEGWDIVLTRKVPTLGHRNWIVVADSAYPAQTSPGITTIVTHSDHFTVLDRVLKELSHAGHVRPVAFLDAELPFVDEKDAPGIGKVRAALKERLAKLDPKSLPHEQIIAKLDKAGGAFQILLFKTSLKLPYTSVFFELDCGYWSPEAEKRLREAIKKAGEK